MKTKTRLTPICCQRQQGFRDALQRLTMTLMLVMLTATTAWAATETVSYIDENGQTKSVTATVLTDDLLGSALGSNGTTTWYVVNSSFTHKGRIECRGNVNIILCDGKTMTTSNGGGGIWGATGCTLTIYGQTNGTGTLDATSTGASNHAISINGNIVICGGTVNATDTEMYGSGIVAVNVIINGGTITATGSDYGIRGDNVTINGGKVTATGQYVTGIKANNGTITLGWTNADDFIKASSYEGTVNIADGYALLTDDIEPVQIKGTNIDKSQINGKKLTPDVSSAFTDNGDGTYTINNAAGWGLFCDRLAADDGKTFFSGKTVKLGKNITVTRMAGSDSHEFSGTFDGNKKTLTVSYENTDNTVRTAPFSYVDGATIQNLIVSGSITGSKYRAAGIVGETNGTMSHITNCVSSLTISGDRYTCGFSIGGNVEIEGCVFNGKINGSSYSGGFVGYSNSALKIKNCLFAPQSGSSISGGTFYYNGGGEITPVNSYYTQALGTAQGKALRSITADANVTIDAIALTGDETEYNVSGITAYSNGGLTLDDGNNTTLYYGSGDQVSLTLAHEDREGYDFGGGYSASAGTLSGSDTPYTLTMPDENVTVTAQWSPITYNIDYILDGGSVDPANPTSFTIETPTFTLNNPTKPGYTFTGWTGTGLTGITTTVVIEQGSTTHRTYTANYEFAQITEGDLTFVCTSGTEAKVTACNQSATSVTIPTTVTNDGVTYTVTAIEATAFSGCTSLNTLILKAATPPALGSTAFSACTKLNTIYVPSDAVDTYKTADNWKDYADKIQGYDTCGDNVYYAYDSTSKTLHLFGTGAMADYNSTNKPWHSYRGDITTVVIDDGVTSIGQKAFSGCTGLTSIEISDNVTSIGGDAFYNCTNLKTVFIGNGVTSIGNYAFWECPNLKTVIVSRTSSAPSLGTNSFPVNANLKIYIPVNITSQVHQQYTSGNWVTYRTANMLVDSWMSGTCATTINNHVLTVVGFALAGYAGPNSRGDITSVVIDESVTSIGNGAFSGCDNLATITVDANNQTFDARDNCNAIIRTADNELVAGCKTTVIPNSVTSIGDHAFESCGLTTISIPDGVTSIGVSAFGGNGNLTSITIPASVTSIGWSAFYQCGLTTITIPDGVQSIGESAFSSCYNLESVHIGSGLTSIDGSVFGNCDKLATITVDANNQTFDSRDNCNAIIRKSNDELVAGCKTTVIPNSVTSIGEQAFNDHDGLTAITIPASVTSIGVGAFHSCGGLNTVTIGSGVTSIGSSAFISCNNLESVTIYATSAPTLVGSVFASNKSGRKIYVFSDRVDAYKSAWDLYASAIEDIPALAVHDAGGELGSWCTYYNGLADATVADGTTVYTAKRNNAGGVTLTATGSRIIKRGEAVLLKSTANVVLSSAASSGDGVYDGNELLGVDCETAQDANTTYYVLSKPAGKDFGFYKLARENSNSEPIKLGANKAYLAVASAHDAPEFIGFSENTTAINEHEFNESHELSGAIYDLQGRKIAKGQKPTAKGLYIVNGKKVIIK